MNVEELYGKNDTTRIYAWYTDPLPSTGPETLMVCLEPSLASNRGRWCGLFC